MYLRTQRMLEPTPRVCKNMLYTSRKLYMYNNYVCINVKCLHEPDNMGCK